MLLLTGKLPRLLLLIVSPAGQHAVKHGSTGFRPRANYIEKREGTDDTPCGVTKAKKNGADVAIRAVFVFTLRVKCRVTHKG